MNKMQSIVTLQSITRLTSFAMLFCLLFNSGSGAGLGGETERARLLAEVDRKVQKALDDYEKDLRKNAARLRKSSPKVSTKVGVAGQARAAVAQRDFVDEALRKSFGHGSHIHGAQIQGNYVGGSAVIRGHMSQKVQGKMPTLAGLQQKSMEDAIALKKLQESLLRLEQERRGIIVKYPEDGDPQYTKHNGMLFTDDEMKVLKVLEEGSPTPREKADQMVKALEANGVVRGLAYAGTYENPQIKEVVAIKYYSLVNEGKDVKKVSAFALVNKVGENDWHLMNFLSGSPPSSYRLVKDTPGNSEAKAKPKQETPVGK